MFVLSLQRGRSFELLAASDDIEKLRNKMKDEVLNFLSEVYGRNC